MPIRRAEICEEHKPRVYKDQCPQCKLEETRKIYRPEREETEDEQEEEE